MAATLNEIGLIYGTDKTSVHHDYLRHYDYFMQPFRDKEILLFEIGGLNGASLKTWNEYFPGAQIVCLDINPEVKKFEEERIKVEIGNSGQPNFLQSVCKKYGNPDIVLDDGSHRWDHQRIAFESLFPSLKRGGLFVVEDLHTNFEPRYAGEDKQPFTDFLQQRINYLHMRGAKRKEYALSNPANIVALSRQIDSVTYVPRSCIIKKSHRQLSPDIEVRTQRTPAEFRAPRRFELAFSRRACRPWEEATEFAFLRPDCATDAGLESFVPGEFFRPEP